MDNQKYILAGITLIILTILIRNIWVTSITPDSTSTSRAKQMISKMNLDQKLNMVHGCEWNPDHDYIGRVQGDSSLGIPNLNLQDAGNGVRNDAWPGTSTCWPSAQTIGASWDKDLVNEWGTAMAKEFWKKGANVALGPAVNVARVPRNGRNFEYMSGEDPKLGSQLAPAVVKALQAQNETDRGDINSIVDERTQWEIYHPPFIAAVEAGVMSAMCSYNQVNGHHACDSSELLNDHLKGKMGFKGWVMSDWWAKMGTVSGFNNGCDQEMPAPAIFADNLKNAVNQGQVSQDRVNDAVERILTPMYEIGMFDNKTCNDCNVWDNVTSTEHQTLARKLSRETSVLLKNEDNILPLKARNITVFGKFASTHTIVHGGGSGAVNPSWVSAPIDALREKYFAKLSCGQTGSISCSNLKVGSDHLGDDLYNKVAPNAEACCEIAQGDSQVKSFAYAGGKCYFKSQAGVTASKGDTTYGEPAQAPQTTCKNVGLNQDHFGNDLYNRKAADVQACCDIAKQDTKAQSFAFKDGICYLKSGKGVTSSSKGVVYGEPHQGEAECHNGYCIQFSQSFDQDLAKWSQVNIVFAATTSAEAADRNNLDLEDSDLISQVAQVNPNTIAVVQTPGHCLMPWKQSVKAIIMNYLPGQEHGHAIVDVLSGDYNPSARLTVTIPNKENEIGLTQCQFPGCDGSSTYSEKLEVGYRWYNAHNVVPAFRFGYGLSYTKFEYTKFDVKSNNGGATVSFTVSNVGKLDGQEVSQVWVDYPESAGEPKQQLKGFQKMMIKNNGSADVVIELSKRDLSIWNVNTHDWLNVAGIWNVCVGGTPDDLACKNWENTSGQQVPQNL